MALRANVMVAVELVMAHSVAMETSGPILYVGVQKGFVILGKGKIGRVRGARVIRDMKSCWECGAFCL